MLTISELKRVLDALEDETYCEYQAGGERSTFPDIVVDPTMHLMHMSVPCPI